MTINATVTTGKRSVGMLSLTGIRAREAYASNLCGTAIPRRGAWSRLGASARKESGQTPKGGQLRIRKISVALAAAVTAGALVMASMALARGANTGVTIKGPEGDFRGKVLSEKSKCEVDRKVIVYKQKGKKQDPSIDRKIASDISERRKDYGRWEVGNTGYKKGKFYAKAKRSEGCAAGRSETIKL
jgi:hypothetical protein